MEWEGIFSVKSPDNAGPSHADIGTIVQTWGRNNTTT